MGILARAAPELGPITWGAFCWCSTEMGHHLAYKFSLGGQGTGVFYGRLSCLSNKDYFFDVALLEHCQLELLWLRGR